VYGDGCGFGMEGQRDVVDIPHGFLSQSSGQARGPGDGCLVVRKYVDVSAVEASLSHVFLAGDETFIDGPEFGVEDFHCVAHGDNRFHGVW
jgi:hypothetical protein